MRSCPRRACILALPLLAALVLPAGAQGPAAERPAPSEAQAAQRGRMKTCNADAGARDLSGEARKGFMSDCLAGKTADTALTPQQARMKRCNGDAAAKSLKGAERKAFMTGCLKN